ARTSRGAPRPTWPGRTACATTGSTSMSKVYDAFGPVPGNIPPSTPVRYWDRALIAAAFAFCLTYPALFLIAWLIPGQLLTWTLAFKGGLAAFGTLLTGGISFRDPARAFFHEANGPTLLRMGLVLAGSATASGWMLVRGLTPQKNEWHTKGPQLLEGREAVGEARRRSLTKKEIERGPHYLALHPDLVLGKRQWSRHAWLYGSVGSGKTVLLLPL